MGKRAVYLSIMTMFMMLLVNISVIPETDSNAEAWFDGEPLSDAYPNYGIQDMIADEAFLLLKANYPEKAEFIEHWYLPDGADNWEDSFDKKNQYPDEHDNFLAYIDGAPEGDRENYFIHNSKGHEDTDAPTYVQKYVNYTVENLTKWMVNGMVDGNKYQHVAVRHLAWASHLVGDMSQVGHTDYSRWDQYASPVIDPYDGPYQLYYERFIWKDDAMNQLISDFESRSFKIPDPPEYDNIHNKTADLAKWVNSRGQDPVTMMDDPPGLEPEEITVGPIYKQVVEEFRYNWNNQLSYKNVTGMNGTLWNLTMEHIAWATENLTAFYISVYDEAWSRFLDIAPDVSVESWSLDPPEPIAGDNVVVTAKIVNRGNMSTGGMVATLRKGGFSSRRPLNIEAGGSNNVTFNGFDIGTGDVTFNITADSDEEVFETREDNNMINGSFTPIQERHGVEAELKRPFNEIRRDTAKSIKIEIHNTGNRFDLYDVEATVTGEDIIVVNPDEQVGVEPGEIGESSVIVITEKETPLGVSAMDIEIMGRNDSATISLTLTVLGRTNDPVPPAPEKYSWTRVGDNVTLEATGWSDPDGDPLTFTWVIPDRSNETGDSISINYTETGEYELTLTAFDGNVSVSIPWILEVFPQPPETMEVVPRSQFSAVELNWPEWKAGGLVAYWIVATASPGQGDKSQRGPFIEKIGEGNTTGRAGSFFTDTQVEVEFFVEVERFGNISMFSDVIVTNSSGQFDTQFNLDVENLFLNINYKPFVEPEGREAPDIEVRKLFKGEYVPLDSTMEVVARTPRIHTVRYPVGSNTGSYNVTLVYYFEGGGEEVFTIYEDLSIPNKKPELEINLLTDLWELDDYESEGGESMVRLTLVVEDPGDRLNLTIDWDDGTVEELTLEDTNGEEINHTYDSTGTYNIEMTGYDWSGESAYSNVTVKVIDYKEDEPVWSIDELSPWQIVLIIVVFIIIVILIVIFGYTAYKFAKKETTVDFDEEKMKKPHEKVGTGTDFDERKKYLVPKESIMGGPKSKVKRTEEEKYPEPETDESDVESGGKGVPIIEGEITFDEEE